MTESDIRRSRRLDRIVATAVFLAVFLSHVASGNNFAFDSKWTIHLALSLIREGNTDLDEYRDFITAHDEYGALETFGGHVYTNFPIGPSLVAVPFVFVSDQLARHVWSFDLQTYVRQTIPADIERVVASAVVALTAGVVYAIARRFLNRPRALFVTFVFAFCTSAWSTASRSLWQHGPSMLMLALTLYLFVLAQKKPALSQFAGLPLAFAYVTRPGNSLSVMLLTAFVFIRYRRYFVRYLLWAAVVAVPFVAYNWSIYHSPLAPYYTLYRGASPGEFLAALFGTLFSPSRGLFVFSPVLLLSVAGVARAVRGRSLPSLDAFLVATVVLHWVITSLWPIWWGGWSFGPRLFADVIPYLIYLMLPVVAKLPAFDRPAQLGWSAAVLALTGLSFFIHDRGANVEAVMNDWNAYPANVDTHPERLWDWRDVQFLRGITWGTPLDVSISGVPFRQMGVTTYQTLGTNVLHVRRFDVSTSLFAAPGSAWLILADGQPAADELEPILAGLAPRAAAQTPESGIAYQLYQIDLAERLQAAAQHSEQVALWSAELYPAPGQTRPVALPAQFGQTADLIGFQTFQEPTASRLSVLTFWRVHAPAVTPLRIFMHAIGRDGQLVAQGDRLDARSQDWRPGDVFAQIGRLDLPADPGPVWIELGLYNPDSGERLPVLLDGQPVDGRLLLKFVQPD